MKPVNAPITETVEYLKILLKISFGKEKLKPDLKIKRPKTKSEVASDKILAIIKD